MEEQNQQAKTGPQESNSAFRETSEISTKGKGESKKKILLIFLILGITTATGVVVFICWFLITKPYIKPTGLVGLPCEYNGLLRLSGSSFDSIDGCNTCRCEHGVVSCTYMSCD